MTTCPIEAVFGGTDEERYPCTHDKGHDGPHSFEGMNPPSAADLAGAPPSSAILLAACEALAMLIRREYGDGPIAPDVATFTEATPSQLAAVKALDAYWAD